LEFQFDNRLSPAFVLRNAVFALDGCTTFSHLDEPDQPADWQPRLLTPFRAGTLLSHDRFLTYSGSLPKGKHTIQVALGYRGSGAIHGYWFVVKSSHSVALAPGQALHLTATAYEKGGAGVPLEQRPTVEWREDSSPVDAGADADFCPDVACLNP
jgi:hypothetical protein